MDWPPKKKITIELPEYKPDPDPPPRVCRLCELERSGFQFGYGHPDVCFSCRDASRHGLGGLAQFSWADLSMMSCAKAVIRRLQYGG